MSYQDFTKVPSRTKHVITLRIETQTTAGVVRSDRGVESQEPGGVTVVANWESENANLDALIDQAHNMLKLCGGTITGFVVDAPHGRGVMAVGDLNPVKWKDVANPGTPGNPFDPRDPS